jgi:hypothetical protein
MPYATVSEVQGEFKKIAFSTTSLVTEADVEAFIAEADALINSYVSQRYQLPVGAGEGLTLLRMYSRVLVSHRVRGILSVKSPNDLKQEPNAPYLSVADILKNLEKLKNGDLALTGATPVQSGGGMFSNTYAQGVEPRFRKDLDQW